MAERQKTIKTHDFGTITVGTLMNCGYCVSNAVQFLGAPSTVIDLRAKADMVNAYSACPASYLSALTTEQPIEYDRTTEINNLNQYVYWIWGGVSAGGIGLWKNQYNMLGFIYSHGSYISNSTGKLKYDISGGSYWGNYGALPDELKLKSFAMAYYNMAVKKTNLINPYPADNYYQNVAILFNGGWTQNTSNTTDPWRYWKLKYNEVTVGSVTFERPYYDPTPNNQNWFGTNELGAPMFDGAWDDYRSIVDNVVSMQPHTVFQCAGAYPWYSDSYVRDDEYYGLAGYSWNYGHWYGDEQDDEGGNEGGDGDGDDSQGGTTPNHVTVIPSDVTDTGFVRLYKSATTDLRALANFMFATLTTDQASALKKLLSNPLDYIICLNACHFDVTAGDYEEIKIGGINTTVQSRPVGQFVTLNGGSYTIAHYWGNYLDYAPYTKVQIHIPYCGTHELDVDMVMNSTLTLSYEIDLLSGSMVAQLSISKPNDLNNQPDAIEGKVIETYTGNVFTQIPIANTDYRQMIASVLGIASSAVSSIASSNPLPLTSGIANAVTNSKTTVTKNGSISNNYGYMSHQDAFLIISRPCLTMGSTERTKFHDWMGFPSNMVKTVGQFSGVLTIQKGTFWGGDNSKPFTSITDEEKKELEQIMEGGICV